MANHYTHFAFLLSQLTSQEEKWLSQRESPGFNLEFGSGRPQGRFAHIYDESGTGLDEVEALMIAFIAKWRADSIVVIEWADTCSKARPGAFGGGAVYITATKAVAWNTASWGQAITAQHEDDLLEKANEVYCPICGSHVRKHD